MPLYEDDPQGRFDGVDPLETARIHYERGRFAEAARELRTMIERDPSDAGAHSVLALCLHRMGRPAEGNRTLGRALKMAPRDPMVNSIAGLICVENDNFEQAESYLLTTLDVHPRDDETMRLLAVTRSCRGDVVGGLEVAQRGLEMNPQNPGLWTVAGVCQHELGKNADARKSLSTAIQLDEFEPEAHFTLGVQNFAEDRFEEAAGCFKKAIRANPLHKEARKRLIWTRFHQQVREDAETADGSGNAIFVAARLGLPVLVLARLLFECFTGRTFLEALKLSMVMGAIGAVVLFVTFTMYYIVRFAGARRRVKGELSPKD